MRGRGGEERGGEVERRRGGEERGGEVASESGEGRCDPYHHANVTIMSRVDLRLLVHTK
jgi:hypothetical protein